MALPHRIDDARSEDMADHVRAATDLMKALAHETRLMILCALAEGDRSVGELEEITQLRQPSVSQQLARLRLDGLVTAKRDGRSMTYSIGSEEARRVVTLLYELYCKGKD